MEENKCLTLKERVERLLSVKSLVTLILTGVFSYVSLGGVDVTDTFKTVYVMVIGFYFGVQTTKGKE